MTKPADVDIQGDQIYSNQFDDVYFSREEGLAESQYVFLDGNDLPRRWQQQAHFCIVETGFGSGLNFLLSAQAWLDDPNSSDTLDYYSIEGFPLSADQLLKIHAHWGQYKGLSKSLIEQYPVSHYGCHSLIFDQGRIQLHLILENIQDALRQYELDPDCWFLDGFAPAKNPQMWNAKILSRIGELSAPGTLLATFTAAGQVRRDLMDAGFNVRKRKGFGRKREMICAVKKQPRKPKTSFKQSPWFAIPNSSPTIQTAAVIGAGIAGAQIAHHLAGQGVKVQVIESEKYSATGASGNLAGILAPRINAQKSDGEAFYIAAFLYQLSQLKRLQHQCQDIHFTQHGLLQLAHNSVAQSRFQKLAERQDLPAELVTLLRAEQVSKILGQTSKHSAILIHSAGSLAPKRLCKALLAHDNIELRCNLEVESISHNSGKPVLSLAGNETMTYDAVIIASGHQAAKFSDALQITPVRGQSSSATLAAEDSLPHALGHQGYVASIPGDDNKFIFGASYLKEDSNSQLRPLETQENLATLRKYAPQLADNLSDISDSHAGIRATTIDRWPIVGPLPDTQWYRAQYADLGKGRQYKVYPIAQYYAGIYVLTGLGSHGLTSAAYCANLLGHIILGKSPPASAKILRALHPARFLIRTLKST